MDLWSQIFHSCTQKRPIVGSQNWHLQHPPIVIDFKRLPLQSGEFLKTLFKSWSRIGTGNMSTAFSGFPQSHKILLAGKPTSSAQERGAEKVCNIILTGVLQLFPKTTC